MAWYNPIDDAQWVAGKIAGAAGDTFGGGQAGTYANVRGPNGEVQQVPSTYGSLLSQQTGLPAPVSVDDPTRQALLAQQGGLAGQFATQNQQTYNAYGQQGNAALAGLQAQMQGKNSVSAEQLRQALGQQQAQQMSFAAGGAPSSAAMRARTAAIQMGRNSTAMAGQQSIAGLQERNQATNQYGQLLGTLRGQDLNAALQSRQNAESGYGAGMTGAPQPTWIQQYGPAIAAGAAYAASDRRLKKDVKDGGAKADAMLDALRRASTYHYKDEKWGEGEYTGPMAQDLERAGSRAVIDTPAGKMVHGARLATENTAMLAALRDRVARLEGRHK